MKKAILPIGLVLMILINSVLIYLLFTKPSWEHPPRPNPAGIMNRISDQLDLDADQKEAYQQLARAHGRQMDQLDGKQAQLLNQYFDQLKEVEEDSLIIASTLEELDELNRRKATITFQHFEDLKGLLREDQIPLFQHIIDDVIAVIKPGRKKFPPPPRD